MAARVPDPADVGRVVPADTRDLVDPLTHDLDVDAVVIGAGPNGLMATCLLAQAGWDVVLLERNQHVGGAVSSVERTPGYISDLYSSFLPAGRRFAGDRLPRPGVVRGALAPFGEGACAHPAPAQRRRSHPAPEPRGHRGRSGRRRPRGRGHLAAPGGGVAHRPGPTPADPVHAVPAGSGHRPAGRPTGHPAGAAAGPPTAAPPGPVGRGTVPGPVRARC